MRQSLNTGSRIGADRKNREYVAKRYESAARIFNALIQKGVDRGEFKPMAPGL
ncbi:hypothetical protein [Fictibacillus sp. NRS-1165]|uniref:hypothetical protein n=1 Tax=Fictibacillus sp. NRS-1165 TaxID=3144463 RepID=UPI003D1F0201